MKKGELDETLRRMKFQFHLQHGVEPNTVLVPWSRRQLFVAGAAVDMDADVDPALMLDALEHDTPGLVIHDMVVRLSRAVDDVTVTRETEQ